MYKYMYYEKMENMNFAEQQDQIIRCKYRKMCTAFQDVLNETYKMDSLLYTTTWHRNFSA